MPSRAGVLFLGLPRFKFRTDTGGDQHILGIYQSEGTCEILDGSVSTSDRLITRWQEGSNFVHQEKS